MTIKAGLQLSLKVTLLGTGTSHGVPMIGCECAVCRSPDPRDRRTRPSILLETESTLGGVRSVLVDTAPDLKISKVHPGDSVHPADERHARANGLIVTDDEKGRLEQTRAGAPPGSTRLVLGQNNQTADAHFSHRERYSRDDALAGMSRSSMFEPVSATRSFVRP